MKKRMNNKTSLLKSSMITLFILLIALICLFPLLKNLKFGLDLAGGFEVLYKVDSLNKGEKVTTDMVNSTYKIIEKRINVLGVSEPEISIEGNNIRVQLAGVTDADEARNTISKVGSLTFRDVNDKLLMNSDVLVSGGASVATNDKTGGYEVSLQIKNKDEFYKVTKEISKRKDNLITIWLDFEDGKDSYYKLDSDGNKIKDANGNYETEKCGDLENSHCLSAATVSQGFASDVVIQGNFSKDEVTGLVELINSGSMPTKLSEISSRTVTASFGEDSLDKTFVAGVVGISAIIILLILLYRLSGFIAGVGIMSYIALTLTIFELVGGKLTLQGIAALVIGIGMAVDSVIICFSRIREELKRNVSLKTAYQQGSKQSFMSILDANVTTLLVAIILFIFGESSVKGFATMLIISIVVTFIIMVVLMRVLISLFVRSEKFENHKNLFIGYKESKKESKLNKLNFVKFRKPIFIIVGLLIVVGGLLIFKNGLNLGIDFKGGSTITIASENKISTSEVKKDISTLKYDLEDIEQIDDSTVYVTISDVLNAKTTAKTEKYFNDKYEANTSVGAVSNIVKKNLTLNAIKALIIACIGIIIYISIRFKFNYAVSSIVALVHDSVMVVILFALLRLEVSSIFIAAILSIIGYSINNTIVVFDRIRENKTKLYKDKIKNINELENLVNVSLSQTLMRCLITTLTTIMAVVALIVLGSYEILNFNLALLFGLIVGTFSSLFIAAQLWLEMEKRKIGKKPKKKWYEDEKCKKKEPEELNVKGINC